MQLVFCYHSSNWFLWRKSFYHHSIVLQNLDVNLAVNNLLSRDDDETDDHDDGSEAYIPGGKCQMITHFYIATFSAVLFLHVECS